MQTRHYSIISYLFFNKVVSSLKEITFGQNLSQDLLCNCLLGVQAPKILISKWIPNDDCIAKTNQTISQSAFSRHFVRWELSYHYETWTWYELAMVTRFMNGAWTPQIAARGYFSRYFTGQIRVSMLKSDLTRSGESRCVLLTLNIHITDLTVHSQQSC